MQALALPFCPVRLASGSDAGNDYASLTKVVREEHAVAPNSKPPKTSRLALETLHVSGLCPSMSFNSIDNAPTRCIVQPLQIAKRARGVRNILSQSPNSCLS